MDRFSPRIQERVLRKIASQIIFAWGSVVSAAWYAVLTVLGRDPLVDDHITVTAIAMLASYLLFRFGLDLWLYRARQRSEQPRE